jgi:peptidoglycan/LPS O-acetylase OafA/YrhL
MVNRLAGAVLLSMVVAAEGAGDIEPGPLSWLAVAVAVIPTILVALWNRNRSGPGPLASAAVCGVFLAVATVMLFADKGAGELISRYPLLLLLVAVVWLVSTLTIYVSLRRETRGRG